MPEERLAGSFRDGAGHVFTKNGLVHRRITALGVNDYRLLMTSGLYDEATKRGLLVPHKEEQGSDIDGVVILPFQLQLISYPYEWCFSQLKDGALCTLALQELAISQGMSLKDASAYNIQFVDGKPIFIDTSSFAKYEEGEPWRPYRQFCEHFLAPLLLMSRVDPRLGRMQRTFIDGIPVDVAARMVKRSTWLNPWLYMHLRLHGQAKRSSSTTTAKEGRMAKSALLGLLRSLRSALNALTLPNAETEWSDYSSATSYASDAAGHKHELLADYLQSVQPQPGLVWDLGANSGEFSRIFSSQGIPTVAWDGDAAAVERNYTQIRKACEGNLLPLVQDFANPSPALGWANEERMSFVERGPADLVLALALIHHLVIGNSVPLDKVADFFAKCGEWLIIEFVGPPDPRVQQLSTLR